MSETQVVYEKSGPARGDKSEAIRRKYCLANNQVYDANGNKIYDNFAFFQNADSCGEVYLCFEECEMDSIVHNGKLFFIRRVRE